MTIKIYNQSIHYSFQFSSNHPHHFAYTASSSSSSSFSVAHSMKFTTIFLNSSSRSWLYIKALSMSLIPSALTHSRMNSYEKNPFSYNFIMIVGKNFLYFSSSLLTSKNKYSKFSKVSNSVFIITNLHKKICTFWLSSDTVLSFQQFDWLCSQWTTCWK